MKERLVIDLYNRQQAWVAIQQVLFPKLKEVLQTGKKWQLTLARPKRTTLQNRRYWGKGVLSQIATQAVVGGRQYEPEIWHEYFKRKFIGVQELPNGELIGDTSTTLTTAEFSAFCDQVEAYGATELGVIYEDLPPHE